MLVTHCPIPLIVGNMVILVGCICINISAIHELHFIICEAWLSVDKSIYLYLNLIVVFSVYFHKYQRVVYFCVILGVL